MKQLWLKLLHKLFPFCIYLGRNVYGINTGGDIFTESPESKLGSRLVILGKQAYFEMIAEFPFGNVKEIEAAIAMDPETYAPFQTPLFFIRKIIRHDDKTLVNIWFVRPEIVALIDRMSPWLIFPETVLWCLGAYPGNGLHIVKMPAGYLFVHFLDGAIRSTSAENDDTDLIAFLRSIGREASPADAVRTDHFETYLQYLRDAVPEIPLSELRPFFKFRLRASDFDMRSLKRSFALIGITIVLYLAGWVGMPIYFKQRLIVENETISAVLNDILERQAGTDALLNDVKQLTLAIKGYTPRTMLLNMLYKNLPTDTIITNMTIAGSKIELRGSAGQASQVLSSLSMDPGVEHPQFTMPMRKDYKTGRELFVLSFDFNVPGTTKSS